MMFFRIGMANIRRHGRRSALILVAIAVSVIVMEFVAGMLAGMRDDFYSTLLNDNGHVRMRAQGVEESLNPYSLDLLVENPAEPISIAESIPGVVGAEGVLSFGALLAVDEKNSPMVGYGVAADTSYFADVRDGLVAGRFLSQPGEILISESSAVLFDLDVGDSAVLLVEDSSGAPYYLEYSVAGIFRSNSGQFDDTSVLILLSDAQELLYVGDGVREIRVRLADPNRANEVAQQIAARLDSDGRTMDVQTWEQINGSMVVLLEMFDVFMYAINVIIVVVAGTVITNAILMNVFEKIREFGTMRAIGLTQRGQFKLVMVEGLAYGVVGSAIGLLIGILLVRHFSVHGIYFGEVMESMGLGRAIHTAFRASDAVVNGLFGVLVALAGSLYAGLVATRMKLIDTLRESA